MTYEMALEYAIANGSIGIVEKDSCYRTAQNWREIGYAIENDWNFVGEIADLLYR